MKINRREFLATPAFLQGRSIEAPCGAMVGDVVPGRATVWCRAAREARMSVSWRASASSPWNESRPVECTTRTDRTARVELSRLPPGQTILYRVQFEGVTAVEGRFRSAPGPRESVRFLWSGDVAGQGWGINREWGGYRIFEAMRRREPHFYLSSGDNIYADQTIPEEVKLADGTMWRNVVTPEKSKVAETLEEFRGNYRYNFLDDHYRRFNAEVAQVWQWDDHEVMNNWSPGKLIDDPRYGEKSLDLLVQRARQAFFEYAPLRASGRIYRQIPYGPLLDVFVLDMRSYRAANSYNLQERESAETLYLGAAQRAWLKDALRRSRAVWKVIASDMPVGIPVGDGKDDQGRPRFEAVANSDGPPLGRELEIAELLSFVKRQSIRNTVWITADVHYTAAHHYHPDRAQFRDFLPFWEFVAGPANAGTFGPGRLDNTFGPEVAFFKAPPPGQGNLPPSAGLQFFGEVEIDGATGGLTVTLCDLTGTSLYVRRLDPER